MEYYLNKATEYNRLSSESDILHQIYEKKGDLLAKLGLYKKALADGHADFTTIYGSKQELSREWFEDLSSFNPLDRASKYQGEALVIYGDDDSVVSSVVSKATAAGLGSGGEVSYTCMAPVASGSSLGALKSGVRERSGRAIAAADMSPAQAGGMMQAT